MGGEIRVESEPGKGSRFHFTARLGRVRGPRAERAEPGGISLQGVSALVVDDNPTNRRILEEQLRGWGMKPETAASAREALALTKLCADRHDPFQVLLTDLHMPEMDGFGLVDQWRRNQPGTKQPVILMISSGESKGDLARSREMGIAALLTKPVRRAELRAAISAALSAGKNPGEPGRISRGEIRPSPNRSLRVLLAEDNKVNQLVACGILERAGHTVEIARDGAEVLPMLSAGSFDVVLMDIQMPGMDGFQATAAIRRGKARSPGCTCRSLP